MRSKVRYAKTPLLQTLYWQERILAQALGLDFGTTNTVMAVAEGDTTRSIAFTSATGTSQSMRTALSFMKDPQLGASALKVEAGSAAIREFIDNPGECRFLQSIKTFAASHLFQGTLIFGKRQTFEALMEVFIRRLNAYAGDDWPQNIQRLVVGRPVHFAGANPDAALALHRYNEALSRFGFPELHYVYEPVAAAFFYARTLTEDSTVLVADFGGGTTDYSIIRFEKSAGQLKATPLGHSGVGVAGDQFDACMIDHIVAPRIGKGSHFKSFDKILDVPSSFYAAFSRWNQLSIFKTTKEFSDMKGLLRSSLEPEKLELFIDLVEHDEGYPLYQAISQTKVALSSEEETEFRFAPLGPESIAVKRKDFEHWIADDLVKMETALDELFQKTQLTAGSIDRVFMTGGTSFVPAVRRMFTERFDNGRIESGNELLSIAHGLTLIGERDDVASWTS